MHVLPLFCCLGPGFPVLLSVYFIQELVEILVTPDMLRVEHLNFSIVDRFSELSKSLLLDLFNLLSLVDEFGFIALRSPW